MLLISFLLLYLDLSSPFGPSPILPASTLFFSPTPLVAYLPTFVPLFPHMLSLSALYLRLLSSVHPPHSPFPPGLFKLTSSPSLLSLYVLVPPSASLYLFRCRAMVGLFSMKLFRISRVVYRFLLDERGKGPITSNF